MKNGQRAVETVRENGRLPARIGKCSDVGDIEKSTAAGRRTARGTHSPNGRSKDRSSIHVDEKLQGLTAWCCAIRSISKIAGRGTLRSVDSIRQIVRSLEPSLELYGASELLDIARRFQTAEADEMVDLVPLMVAELRECARATSRYPVSILLLSSASGRVEEIERELLAEPNRVIHTVFSVAEADEAVDVVSPDLIIVGVEPEDVDRRKFIMSLLSHPRKGAIPTVVITSRPDPVVEAECYAVGAEAVLEMPKDTDICSTMVAAILRRRAFLERMAQEDYLTGIPNRAAFARSFDHLRSLARRNGEPLSLGLLDVDCLKEVNDRLGHGAGDSLLKTLARSVGNALRNSDVLARWGGDEFAVLLPRTGARGAADALEKARQGFLRATVGKLGLSSEGLRPGFSAGVTSVRYEDSLEDAVARADQALYGAKRFGGNQVEVETAETLPVAVAK